MSLKTIKSTLKQRCIVDSALSQCCFNVVYYNGLFRLRNRTSPSDVVIKLLANSADPDQFISIRRVVLTCEENFLFYSVLFVDTITQGK